MSKITIFTARSITTNITLGPITQGTLTAIPAGTLPAGSGTGQQYSPGSGFVSGKYLILGGPGAQGTLTLQEQVADGTYQNTLLVVTLFGTQQFEGSLVPFCPATGFQWVCTNMGTGQLAYLSMILQSI